MIIEQDESMKLLLSTILNLQGCETFVADNFKSVDFEIVPAVIVMDEDDKDTKSCLDVCKIIKESHLYKNTKLIVTSISHEKEDILKSGADLYIPKPYDVTTLVNWVDKFIKEVNL